jgi:Neisseria PilC beta-propeller domain
MTKTTLHTAFALVPPGAPRRGAFGLLLMLAVVGWPQAAEAQLDPLLLLKRSLPNITTPQYRANVLVAVDVAPRMQYDADGNYYDPTEYARGNMWDTALGVTAGNTTARYRRIYQGLTWSAIAPQKFNATKISIVGDAVSTPYTYFYQKTRLGVAKTALDQVIRENTTSVRFGLLKMRQTNPRVVSPADGPVFVSDAGQMFPTDGAGLSLWKLFRGVVDGDNRSLETSTAPLVSPDGANPNTTIQTILAQPFSSSTALMPAGNDSLGVDDAPLAHLLDDVRTEAARLLGLDTQCRNTVAVLITGGGEGTGGHVPSASSIASTFLTVTAGHRVPIYVIAIAPPATAVAELQAIATNSGGRYFEITKAQIDLAAANYVAVPEMVSAITAAVQHGFAQPTDFNTAPTAQLPYGPQSEFQVTSPIVGTVNLKNGVSITGATLPNTDITNPTSGAEIPQRGNVMITAGFAMPGFDARLRAFRMYKPVADITKPSGYKFSQDGTALWLAKTPMADHCNDATASCRNIFTVLPNGTTLAFNESNALTLTPYMNTWDVAGLINFVRRQPLGAIVSSTPAIMDPPSLDPPPDVDYPGFSDDNKDRRTLIFVGANDGMIHAIDGRTGVEVWAFIPFNLLPKLRTLRDGQGVDGFDYFVDSSAKVADVKLGGVWKTLVVFGEGSGGTFYQAFDATLDGMGATVAPDSDNVSSLLSYFNSATRIPFLWSFPRYSIFDVTLGQYGDISASATDHEKSVGQTWSDPAVGQIKTSLSKYTVIAGSGFFPRSSELGTNRGGASAGRSLYLLNAEDGTVFDRKESTPSNDGLAETDDNCVAAAYGCTKMKNALQADPVATGPSDSRFIGTTYIGDLDGNVWRFDIDLDGSNNPRFPSAPIQLASLGADQPIFASMATVSVGPKQYLFFGTGSDLLPTVGQNTVFKLVGVVDNGGSGTVTFEHTLATVDGSGDDEVVSSFPAVAGDIVFFTTTTLKPQNPCAMPDANLYALTFVGSAAYDSDADADSTVGATEAPRVKTLAAAGRATAPFIVDQHLVFGAGNSIQVFGDANDYNNGVGHVGVRILSWRDLR